MIRFTSLPVLLALLALEASAQSNDPINQTYEWSYWTPGARNLAMGSATVACPDDATAASVNPAALVRLEGWNVMVEGRVWEQTSVFVDGGYVIYGSQSSEDIATVGKGEERHSAVSPAYMAIARSFSRVAGALYAEKVAAARTGMHVDEISGLSNPAVGRLDMDIDAVGGALALDLGGGFSLGGSLSYHRLALQSQTGEYGSYWQEGIRVRFRQKGKDWAAGGVVGLSWRPNDRWSAGATYRRGPRFDVTLEAGEPPYPPLPDQQAAYRVPDKLALGIAFKPLTSLLAAVAYRYVRYSQLTDGFTTTYSYVARYGDRFSTRDAAQYYGGLEYQVEGDRSVFLRAGAWYEPAHGIEFEAQAPFPTASRYWRVVFRGGESQMHYSAGAGLDLGKGLRLDAAVELSDRLDVFSLSLLGKF